jgi:hypothetical protein
VAETCNLATRGGIDFRSPRIDSRLTSLARTLTGPSQPNQTSGGDRVPVPRLRGGATFKPRSSPDNVVIFYPINHESYEVNSEGSPRGRYSDFTIIAPISVRLLRERLSSNITISTGR